MSGPPEKLFGLVHEDDELLVVNKPADLVCHPTKGDEYSSLISRMRLHLGQANVHMVNRLDRETTGIVLLAKRDEAARELRKLWESGAVQKSYDAIVHGHVGPESGLIDEPLGPDESSPVAIKDGVRPDGREAQTTFTVASRFRVPRAISAYCEFDRNPGASTRSGFISRTSGIRSSATNCTGTTKTATSRWSSAASLTNNAGGSSCPATPCTPVVWPLNGVAGIGSSTPTRMSGSAGSLPNKKTRTEVRVSKAIFVRLFLHHPNVTEAKRVAVIL